MVEVLAESAAAYRLLEVAMRRRDDADVASDRHVVADTLEYTLLQHAQELYLHRGAHVADLIEKQRAALGDLEAALAGGDRAGEGALLVAEELGLEELGGIAPQLTATNGRLRRGLRSWMACAVTSLPVPDSPRIRTVESWTATCRMRAMTSRIAGGVAGRKPRRVAAEIAVISDGALSSLPGARRPRNFALPPFRLPRAHFKLLVRWRCGDRASPPWCAPPSPARAAVMRFRLLVSGDSFGRAP